MPLTQSEVQERLRQKFGDRSSRVGGKGAARRKYKAAAKTATQDDKRLSSQLKRLSVSQIPAIEEVNLFKDDGSVVHFVKPKVQAEISSNTYVVQGTNSTKKLEELFPDILPQLGIESIEKLKNLAHMFKQANLGAEEVPTLVDETFEDVAKSDEKGEEKKDATATSSTDSTATTAPVTSSTTENATATATTTATDTTATATTATATTATTAQESHTNAPTETTNAQPQNATTNANAQAEQKQEPVASLVPDPAQVTTV